MRELFERGRELEYKLGSVKGYVQNEGVTYDDLAIKMFDLEVKNLIKALGVWKMDVQMFMEKNKIQ